MLSVNREHVLAKLDYFVDVQIWPLNTEINPSDWLDNFPESEEPFAVNLLNAFMYFARPLMEQMFVSAFQSLSPLVAGTALSFPDAQVSWRNFLEQVVVTQVTGETPNPSDSGYLFQRKARQLLGIAQAQISSPEGVLRRLHAGDQTPVVFVDDFVGSGRQFIKTWTRQFDIGDRRPLSFADASSHGLGAAFFYCPLICTEHGRDRILNRCPQVRVSPAHLLSDEYSAFSERSRIWPKEMQEGGVRFLEEASMRAGIPRSRWRGFDRLGLALAFEGSVPNATLPIFYWRQNGWRPLVERK